MHFGFSVIYIYLIIGAMGGLLMGLIGAGIGPIVIPILIVMLPRAGVPNNLVLQSAISTSLAVIICTTIITLFSHHIHNTINWELYKKLLLGSIFGALIGSSLVVFLPLAILKIIFSALFMFLGIKMILKEKIKNSIKPQPKSITLFITSFLIAGFSNLLGVSDGILMVPYLKRFNISMVSATGTATALVLPVSFFGSIPLLISGFKNSILMPTNSFGYVYLPAFFAIVIMSMIFSTLGMNLAKVLPEKYVRNFFGLFVIIISVRMIF